ncbi:MAG: exonuclease, partial [Pseudomonadota bacterium]|nr:exonuclease [Pseudomonadota bacterium]
LTPPDKAQLKQILTLRAQAYQIDTLETIFDEAALEHILTQPSIRSVLNWASHYYRHNIHDVPLPQLPKPDSLSELQTTVQQLKQDIEQLKQHVGLNTQSQAVPAPQAMPASSTDSQAIVLDYLSRQRALLEQNYHKKVIISDSDDLGKLITITQAFKMFTQIKTDYLRLGKRKLPEHLEIITPAYAFVVAFLHLSGGAFVARLKNFNQLVLDHKDKRFRVFRDAREPPVTGKVSKDEIEKLNNTEHGSFYLLEKNARIEFELIYQLIVDEQNRDLDTELDTVLPVLYQQLGHHWLIKILKQGQ